MRIYISGPITGNKTFMTDFENVEDKLLTIYEEQCINIINPAKATIFMPSDAIYEECMNLCYLLLDMADAIYMMDGWKESTGACIEYGYAKAKNLQILNVESL